MATRRRLSRERSSRPSAPPEADWLPQTRSHALMSDARIGAFVEANKSRHSFLWFADVIDTHKDDASQSRMLAKLYGFLYDFIPGGFTGKWSHIRGNDVMEILLCQRKDMAVSRHKATNNVQANFDYLEKWMNKGTDWRDAVRKDSDLVKKKGPKKMLTRYSPANLVALLVLSYPDPKYRHWVGRLQIDWMMKDEVQVPDGFWKGLTRDDIPLIFQLNDPRPSELPLAADYDVLFGSDFVSARKDIRPFLPAWAAKLKMPVDELVPSVGGAESASAEDEAVTGDPVPDNPDHAVPSTKKHGGGKAAADVVDLGESSDGDESDSDDLSNLDSADSLELTELDTVVVKHPNGTAADEPEVANVAELGELLADRAAAARPSEGDLQEWLAQKISTSSDLDELPSWVDRWSERMDKAAYYEEQMIVRSLFLRSIRTLHHLDRAGPRYSALTDAFMLLDTEDGRTRSLPSDEEGNKDIDRIRRLPTTKPLVEAQAELTRLARDDAGRDLLDAIFREQLAFVLELFTDELSNTHLQNVLSLEAARMKLAAGWFQSTAPPQPLDGLAGRMDKNLIESLMLSKWQVRALAVSKSGEGLILTDWQARIYRQDCSTPGGLSTTQYARVKPREVEVTSRKINAYLRSIVTRLFGDLQEPFIAAHGDVWDVCRRHDQASRHKDSSSAEPCRSQKSSLPPQTPARQVAKEPTPFNPFTGLAPKRSCSTDLRKAKFPRLGTDASVGNERLRDELETLIFSARDEAVQRANRKSARRYARVVRTVTNIHQQVEAKAQSSMEWLEAHMEKRVQSVKDELEAQIAELGRQLDEKTRAVKDIPHALGEKSAAHEQPRAQPSPLPGKDGYLAAHCPAPAGWDQDSYDEALLRAGWHYIARFEFPDDGVLADPDAFEATMDRFPELNRQHVATALEHAHHQAYHRPIQREQPEA